MNTANGSDEPRQPWQDFINELDLSDLAGPSEEGDQQEPDTLVPPYLARFVPNSFLGNNYYTGSNRFYGKDEIDQLKEQIKNLWDALNNHQHNISDIDFANLPPLPAPPRLNVIQRFLLWLARY